MQTTTNIGLKTYEANDPTDWLGEFNYNMNKIDTAIGSQNDQIDVIEETAGTAVTTANTANDTASEALTTANTKASINDNVASATTTYSSNKIDELISGAGGAVIDDSTTSLTSTWSSSKINSEVSAKANKISYNNILSTPLNFIQDTDSINTYKAIELYSTDAYIYFDILLGDSTGERFAYFEIKEVNNDTVKYSKYVYKNPITNQVISDIIFIPAGHILTIKAISSEVFTSVPTGNVTLVK